jgi:hypothetical protein
MRPSWSGERRDGQCAPVAQESGSASIWATGHLFGPHMCTVRVCQGLPRARSPRRRARCRRPVRRVDCDDPPEATPCNVVGLYSSLATAFEPEPAMRRIRLLPTAAYADAQSLRIQGRWFSLRGMNVTNARVPAARSLFACTVATLRPRANDHARRSGSVHGSIFRRIG